MFIVLEYLFKNILYSQEIMIKMRRKKQIIKSISLNEEYQKKLNVLKVVRESNISKIVRDGIDVLYDMGVMKVDFIVTDGSTTYIINDTLDTTDTSDKLNEDT